MTAFMNKNLQVLPWMIKFWMKPIPIVDIKFGILHPNNCVFWIIVIDDWKLDEISLSKWQWLQHRELIMAKGCYKEWQIT